MRIARSPPKPTTKLPSPTFGPPMVLSCVPSASKMPNLRLPSGVTPLLAVPILFPLMMLPVVVEPIRVMPANVLAEMTLPTTVLLVALPLNRMPFSFPKGPVPAALVPMKLPWMVLLFAPGLAPMKMPKKLPEMRSTLPGERSTDEVVAGGAVQRDADVVALLALLPSMEVPMRLFWMVLLFPKIVMPSEKPLMTNPLMVLPLAVRGKRWRPGHIPINVAAVDLDHMRYGSGAERDRSRR